MGSTSGPELGGEACGNSDSDGFGIDESGNDSSNMDQWEPVAPGLDATYLDPITEAIETDPGLSTDGLAEAVGLPVEGPLSLIHLDGALSVTITFAKLPQLPMFSA